MTSSNPAGAANAPGAPPPPRPGLWATVAPCVSTAGRGSPNAEQAAAPASAGSAGVDSTLAMRPSAATASVNVPPESVPTRLLPDTAPAPLPGQPTAERGGDRQDGGLV